MEKSNLYPNVTQNQSEFVGGHPTAPPSYADSQPPYTIHRPMPQVNEQTTVVLQHTMNAPFGPRPQNAYCANCGERNLTRVEYENGNKTHIAALLLCVLGCWCCCCIPYCVDSLKNANHYCMKCGNFMGVYNK